MKKIIIYLFLMIFAFTLTGCRRADETANNFKGDIEIAWDDVKDDFNDIDQNIKKDTTYVSNIKGEDIQELTKTIQEGYDKIKGGVTQDNQEEAKKVYEAASRLQYIEENTDKKLTDKQKQVLELGKSMKTLMMHYYGNGDGDYDGAVDDVEQGLENIKGYTEDKWNDFKKQFD